MKNWGSKETISHMKISTRITFIILQVIILLLSAYPIILVRCYCAIKDVRHIKIYTRITFIILRICMTKHKISIDTTLDKLLLSLVGTWFFSIKNVIYGKQKILYEMVHSIILYRHTPDSGTIPETGLKTGK